MAVAHNLLPRIIKSGLGVLSPTAGLSALAGVLRQAASCSHASLGPPPAQLVVSPLDWSKLMAGTKAVFPLFSEFADCATASPSTARVRRAHATAQAALPAVQGAPPVPVRDAVLEIQGIAQRLLGHLVDPDQVSLLPAVMHNGNALQPTGLAVLPGSKCMNT